jgi:hypothetical protein
MPLHPEELRLASSLRELIHEYGTTVEDIEGRLGWETERLTSLLEGREGWRLGDLFEVLSALELAPADFYALLYRFKRKRSAESALDEILLRGETEAGEDFYDEVLDRRFEESQQVLQHAIGRRAIWKRERLES